MLSLCRQCGGLQQEPEPHFQLCLCRTQSGLEPLVCARWLGEQWGMTQVSRRDDGVYRWSTAHSRPSGFSLPGSDFGTSAVYLCEFDT